MAHEPRLVDPAGWARCARRGACDDLRSPSFAVNRSRAGSLTRLSVRRARYKGGGLDVREGARMKSHARVAVIGGGVVGCSVLDPGGTSCSTRFLQGQRSSTYSKVPPTLMPISAITTASLVGMADSSATGSGPYRVPALWQSPGRRRGATLHHCLSVRSTMWILIRVAPFRMGAGGAATD
jgi:hypothetical protein